MRLVASDMDGTIIGHDGRISERTVRAFEACLDSGIEVVFVTGRPPRWLQPLRHLGFKGTVICSNGALTYDLGREEVVASHLLDGESIFEAQDVIRKLYPAARFAAETIDSFLIEPGFADPGSVELLGAAEPRPLRESLNGSGVIKFLARERDITPDEFLHGVAPAVEHLVATTHSAPSVPMLAAGIDRDIRCRRIETVVVFPLVPVTPTSRTSDQGSRYSSAAAKAAARRPLATPICGISRPSRSDSTSAAMAPARAADSR